MLLHLRGLFIAHAQRRELSGLAVARPGTPLRCREPIVLRVGWLLKPEYDWHNHVGYALNLACRATKSPR